MPIEEIKKDLKRSQEALESAERNLQEGDILTAANRAFVACENAIYVLLKLKFGSVSISRVRILTKLREINVNAKEAYDASYDLRIQADYGKETKALPLSKENLEKTLKKVRETVENANKAMNEKCNKNKIENKKTH